MRLRALELQIPKSDPFANDILEREAQIIALTELLRSIDGPCVLAIDGGWGSGKTSFLRMWAQHLRRNRFPTVEFNAWENDYSDDPLISLYSALDTEWKKLKRSDFKQKVEAGTTFMAKLASTLPLVPDLPDALATARSEKEGSIAARLSTQREADKALLAFKQSLARPKKSYLPLVVFVDELDRCRPSFAIEFLEATKHIFDADGVIFILGINLTELENSVEVLYGHSFDSARYLRRFIDHSIQLPNPDRTQFLRNLLHAHQLDKWLVPNSGYRVFIQKLLLEPIQVSLRDIEQVTFHLGLVTNSLPRDPSRSAIPLDVVAVILTLIRFLTPTTYHQLRNGEIDDLTALQQIDKAIDRDSDWWKSENSRDKLFGNTLEQVVIGMHWQEQYKNSSSGPTSPLLEHRQTQMSDERTSYPDTVVSRFWEFRETAETHLSSLLSLIELVLYVPPRH